MSGKNTSQESSFVFIVSRREGEVARDEATTTESSTYPRSTFVLVCRVFGAAAGGKQYSEKWCLSQPHHERRGMRIAAFCERYTFPFSWKINYRKNTRAHSIRTTLRALYGLCKEVITEVIMICDTCDKYAINVCRLFLAWSSLRMRSELFSPVDLIA